MGAHVAEIQSETGWDAIWDGGAPLVVRALAGPSTLEELAEAAGERDLVAARRRIDRLVREGILIRSGERYAAPAPIVRTARQEGMITSLSRYVLPVIMRLAENPSLGFIEQVDVALDESAQLGLRTGMVQDLLDELSAISEQADGPAPACELGIIGTSDVPPLGVASERLIETVKRAARERSTPASAARALVTSIEGHFSDVAKATSLVRSAARRLAVQAKPSATPTYTVVFGFSVRKIGDAR